MADWTSTFAVDNTAEVTISCHVDGAMCIQVQENFNSGSPASADLLQRGRIKGSGQIRIPKGEPMRFTSGPYVAGEPIGTIETSAGSITAQQFETKTL